MAAGKYNITIEQGTTFLLTITLQDGQGVPVDITGATISGMGRLRYGADDPLFTFTCVATNPAQGVFTIGLTDTQTAALDFERGVYDIEIAYPSGTKSRLIQGNVILSKEATK